MKYIFGPVFSRRLGFSLGIDIVPHKICNFDCIYCECGRTTEKVTERKEYVPVQDVIDEVKRFFPADKKNENIDFVTITGSGDPLLHQGLEKIITGIKKCTEIPVAVLTNGLLMEKKVVREALSKADLILPSLDAATTEDLMMINRPVHRVSLDTIIDAYQLFRKEFPSVSFWLEIVFIKGLNDSDDSVNRLVKAAQEINPDRIQINTVARPPAEKNVLPVPFDSLEQIRSRFGKKAEVVTRIKKDAKKAVFLSPKKLLSLIKRRPVTLTELLTVTDSTEPMLNAVLKILENQKKIKRTQHDDEIFIVRED